LSVNLWGEVAGEGEEEDGNHYGIFAAENTKLAGGVTGVADAGVFVAKPSAFSVSLWFQP